MKKVIPVILSLLIIAGVVAVLKGYVSFGQRTVVVVCGTELLTTLQALEARFEQANPGILVEVRAQGSQDMINKYIDDKNDFAPTLLIPASKELLTELAERWRAMEGADAFYEPPRALASTILVAVAWPERGKQLFAAAGASDPGRFAWTRVEDAMRAGQWSGVGGPAEWGSFDFVTTDPTRSSSGQVTLSLWAQSKLGGSLSLGGLASPEVSGLLALVKKGVYQPPRSTDILLQEFISRGPNEADVATVYESVALGRWEQSGATAGRPYQLYYIDPTVETVATAAIVRRNVTEGVAKAASKFLDFALQPEQQALFAQQGFRPVSSTVDINTSPGSAWAKNIPGALSNPGVQRLPSPSSELLGELVKLWSRSG